MDLALSIAILIGCLVIIFFGFKVQQQAVKWVIVIGGIVAFLFFVNKYFLQII